MPKIQQSVSLPPEVWVQIDDLIGYFGESRGEVITYALSVWFRTHGKEIQDERLRIDAPDHLMFSGRSIENEIWRRHVARGADRLKRSTSLLVEIQIGVTYLPNVFFCPVSRPYCFI